MCIRDRKSYTFGNRDALMSQGTINDASGSKTKGFLIGGYTPVSYTHLDVYKRQDSIYAIPGAP